MKHHKIVLPEYMNDQGSLFGGYLLKWLDEFAYVTVTMDYPGNRFVTVALDDVEFRHQIKTGQILCFDVRQKRKGTTSVSYEVQVSGTRKEGKKKGILFETDITFVNIDKEGKKREIFT